MSAWAFAAVVVSSGLVVALGVVHAGRQIAAAIRRATDIEIAAVRAAQQPRPGELGLDPSETL